MLHLQGHVAVTSVIPLIATVDLVDPAGQAGVLSSLTIPGASLLKLKLLTLSKRTTFPIEEDRFSVVF